jgi:thiosulfate/3-mercaptopyruvate sulfurtransferase
MKRIFFLLITIINIYAYDAFIDSKSLKDVLEDKDLVLIDVSDSYKKSHILGSVSFDVDSLGSFEREDLQDKFRDIGITNESHVVVYGRNTNNDIKNSAVLAYALISFGFEDVSILDGGYMAWVFEYDSLTTPKATEDIQEGDVVLKDTNILVDISYIKNTKDARLIDARSPQVYYGISDKKDEKYIGHMSGAKNSYYAYKFLKDKTLRPQNELDEIYKDGLELDGQNDIIVYGESTKDAAIEWYIIYKQMGYTNAKLYHNSFKEYVDLGLKTERFKWE